jgi:hypothetical protein
MTDTDYLKRITFHPDLQVMEVDFKDMTFDLAKPVNAFYDEIERQLKASGKKWFFLVNYKNCRIMSEAWITFAHRGKKVNIAYSLGSVRFSVRDDTGDAILERSQKENFDPNLFGSRKAALDHLKKMRSEIPDAIYEATISKVPEPSERSIDDRVIFHTDLEIMEVDFSDYTFATSADVRCFYDAIATKIAETGRDWYFMVNYDGTEILPSAWTQWAISSRKLNAAHSLGTVRFNQHGAAKKELMKRAEAEHADPNLASSRQDALARINQMRG